MLRAKCLQTGKTLEVRIQVVCCIAGCVWCFFLESMQCCICHAALAAVHLGSLWFFSVHSDPSRSEDMAILVRSPDVSAEMCYVQFSAAAFVVVIVAVLPEV